MENATWIMRITVKGTKASNELEVNKCRLPSNLTYNIREFPERNNSDKLLTIG